MDTNWYNKLIDLLKVQTNSENEKLMVLYLDKELRKLKLPYTIDAAGNLLVVKGKTNLYPCVVSHMDTVHSFVPDFKIYSDVNDEDVLFAMSNKQRVGIGGDDKNGVFACLYLLKVIPQIKVIFFSREESGCRGSRSVDKAFFDDCQYIIQLDRRGSGDFIQTFWGKKTISHEFSSEIGLTKKKYKYKNKTGTLTDVMKLWDDKVGISCINLSCGYYNPHTNNEYISVMDLWHSVKFTEEIINTMQPKRYTSLPPVSVVVSTTYKSPYSLCCKCKKWKRDALLYEVRGSKTGEMICWPCKKEDYTKKLSGKKSKKKPEKDIPGAIIFACYECGVKPSELSPGDSLKEVNGHLYCNGCASILSNNEISPEKSPVICEVCQEQIPENHYRTTIESTLVCGVCACDLRDYLPGGCKCWVCDIVISKDAKIIHRFGKRVCEDCACPSDVEGGTRLVN